MKKANLTTIMFNVLRSNPIKYSCGKYRAALTRLVKEGKAVRTTTGWQLPTRLML